MAIRGKWPLGEMAFRGNANWGKWPLGEKAIGERPLGEMAIWGNGNWGKWYHTLSEARSIAGSDGRVCTSIPLSNALFLLPGGERLRCSSLWLFVGISH